MNPWRELLKRFLDLRDEEEQIIQQNAPRFFIRAVGDPAPTEYGTWRIFHQVGHSFQVRVELACADAARLLGGCPSEVHPVDYWIYRVFVFYQGLLSNRVKVLENGQRVLENICDCSAGYCGRVELEKMYKVFSPQAQGLEASLSQRTIGEQIRDLRTESRWTAEELAEATGIDERTVRRHENGDTEPYARTLLKYEHAFSKRLKRQVVISKTP